MAPKKIKKLSSESNPGHCAIATVLTSPASFSFTIYSANTYTYTNSSPWTKKKEKTPKPFAHSSPRRCLHHRRRRRIHRYHCHRHRHRRIRDEWANYLPETTRPSILTKADGPLPSSPSASTAVVAGTLCCHRRRFLAGITLAGKFCSLLLISPQTNPFSIDLISM